MLRRVTANSFCRTPRLKGVAGVTNNIEVKPRITPTLRHSREMTRVCSPRVTHQVIEEQGDEAGISMYAREALARGQIADRARIVMTTLSLPEDNAFGVDDIAGGTPIVSNAENWAKTLFFVWVTLTEHKWVILGERRGTSVCPFSLLQEIIQPLL